MEKIVGHIVLGIIVICIAMMFVFSSSGCNIQDMRERQLHHCILQKPDQCSTTSVRTIRTTINKCTCVDGNLKLTYEMYYSHD